MSWNYRKMFKQVEEGPFKGEYICGLVECYYTEEGVADGWTGFIVEGSCFPTKEEAEQDLEGTLDFMQAGLNKEPLKQMLE